MGAIDVNYNKLRNPQLKDWAEHEFHDVLFATADGHDHDGVNSKTLNPAAVIANDSITTVKILDNAVTSPKIVNDAVTTLKIINGAVTTAKIGADAIDGTKIADNAVDSEHIVAGAIDTAHIGLLQVTTAVIAADAITGAQLADNAVDSEHYVDGSIDTAHFAAGAVDATAIGADAVITAKILDDNVTNAKLANMTRGTIKVGGAADAPTDLDAKGSGKILIGDGTDITSATVSGDITISATGVTAIGAVKVLKAMIGADAIDGTKLADNAVDSEHITAGSVDTSHFAAITTPMARAITAAHAAAIPVTGNGNLALTIADAAETNTLAVPTFAGQMIAISVDTLAGGGTREITVATAINAAGNTKITLNTAGDFIVLYGFKLGASFAWRILASDGVTLS
jgi:hypothetical protein